MSRKIVRYYPMLIVSFIYKPRKNNLNFLVGHRFILCTIFLLNIFLLLFITRTPLFRQVAEIDKASLVVILLEHLFSFSLGSPLKILKISLRIIIKPAAKDS